MNLTGTNTTAPGYLTAWPTGTKKQTTSNLNFGPGQSVPNLAVVPVGVGGKVSIYNFDGTTDVLGDVVGLLHGSGRAGRWWRSVPRHGAEPVPRHPARCRSALGAGGAGELQITGACKGFRPTPSAWS